MRSRLWMPFYKFFHPPEQARRTATHGGNEPIRPKVSLLALALLFVDLDRDRAQAFEQLQSQHQRQGPKFCDVQRGCRLKSEQKFPDELRLQRAAAFGNYFRRQMINPRQSRLGDRKSTRLNASHLGIS